MKLVSFFVLLFLALVSFVPLVSARFMYAETQKVPVTRLLSNLRKKSDAASGKQKALVEWQIGRLLSMAYALKTDFANQEKGKPESGPYYGAGLGDHTQFLLEQSKDRDQVARSARNLTEAIRHYKEALSLDPTLTNAKLGLAWCLDQSGKKQEALPLYREVFNASYGKESELKGGLDGRSVAMEAALYLLPLLDPKKDGDEIKDIKSKEKTLAGIFRAETPIVVPTAPGVVADELMVNRTVTFDLDGRGPRAYTQWPSTKAGWLVYSAEATGRIDSGLQLFGQRTWWIFWTDGYQALSALDDNGDGKLNGDELVGLALWQDHDYNGISEPGEVKPLRDFAITSLRFDAQQDSSGMLFNSSGVTFEGGKSAPTYDWLVDPVRPSVTSEQVPRL